MKCQALSGWPTQKKWEAAKQFGLCYRCLRDDHLGNECPESKLCNIDGRLKTHHPLLDEKSKKKKESTPPITEGDRTTHATTLNTAKKHDERIIALRTIPVILKHGKTRLLVNCFLDEGSDTTCANEDVIEALGIRASKEQVTINVANYQKVHLMAATVEVVTESIDGKVDIP